MQNWLIKKFIKDYENINDLNVRTAYGKLSGKVGIFCNALLFIGKFAVGTISGSVSITADAVNNLSDAASSIISLLGFKMAEKTFPVNLQMQNIPMAMPDMNICRDLRWR